MLKMNERLRRWVRGATLALAAGTAVTLAGCSDLMEVNNPGAIDTPDINDVYYLDHLVNGVIGQFQPLHGNTALYSAIFTDELANHHGYGEEIDIDHREVADGNGTMAIMTYNRMHRTRWQADTAVQYIKSLLGDAAATDLRVATARAYGAHAIVLLGEQFCESPIDMSAPIPSDEILALALPRFDEAIAVGLAAKAADPAVAARADEIVNFARVGAARAALDLGDFQKAIAYAQDVEPAYISPVDEGFAFYSAFLEGNSTNPFYSRAASAEGVSVSYFGTPLDSIFDDPRVPMVLDSVQGGGVRYVPLAPSGFLEYTGTLPGGAFAITTKIRSASALEARYIIAEAEGLNAANLAFVNERRAIGNQAPLPATATEAQYVDALREQRMRDLLLDGHRLGDLRRYEKLYGDDLWQSGPFPGSTTGAVFGTQKCWPVPQAEKLGNPNYPKN